MDIENNEDLGPENQGETALDDDLASLDIHTEEEGTRDEPAPEQTEDLEKYGVWVKVEPTDVEDTEMGKEENSFDLEDLATDEIETPAQEPAEPEEVDFDDQGLEEEPAEVFGAQEEDSGLEADKELSGISETAEEDSGLDFDEDLSGISEEPEAESGLELEEELAAETPVEDSGLELEEELAAETPVEDSGLELEEEPEEEVQQSGDEFELGPEEELTPDMDMEKTEEIQSGTDSDIEEVSLDDLGITMDSESAEDQEKKSFETSPTETEEYAIHDAVPVASDDEVPPLDIDLELSEDETGSDTDEAAGEEIIFEDQDTEKQETESTEDTMAEELSLPDQEDESLASLDLSEAEETESLEDLPELDGTTREGTGELELEEIGEEEQVEEPLEEIEVPLSEEPNIAEPLEGLEEIEQAPSAAHKPGIASGTEEASPQILLKIEEELKSIKTELTQLKQEIGALRVQKPSDKAAGQPHMGKSDELDEKSFFEEGEEEDETIALTGEELDNILTTAEIKEEQEEESGEVSEEAEQLVDQEDILSYQDEEKEQAVEALDDLEELSTDGLEMEDLGTEPEQGDQLGEIEMGMPADTETAAEPTADAEASDEIEIEIPELEEEASFSEEGQTVEDLDIQAHDELEPSPMEEMPGEEIPDLSIEPLADAETGEEEESTLDLEIEEVPTESIAAEEQAKQKSDLNPKLKEELKSVLGYMDQLLESLPEEKIQEFARSEYFEVYKRLFEELGLAS